MYVCIYIYIYIRITRFSLSTPQRRTGNGVQTCGGHFRQNKARKHLIPRRFEQFTTDQARLLQFDCYVTTSS